MSTVYLHGNLEREEHDKKGSFYLDEGRTLNPNTTDLRGASTLSPAFAAFLHYQGPVLTVLQPKITLKGF